MKLKDKPDIKEYCWKKGEIEYKFVPVLGRLSIDGSILKLTPAESYVLGCICNVFPAPYKSVESDDSNKVIVYRIRRKTSPDIIWTLHGYGWALNCDSVSINNL